MSKAMCGGKNRGTSSGAERDAWSGAMSKAERWAGRGDRSMRSDRWSATSGGTNGGTPSGAERGAWSGAMSKAMRGGMSGGTPSGAERGAERSVTIFVDIMQRDGCSAHGDGTVGVR